MIKYRPPLKGDHKVSPVIYTQHLYLVVEINKSLSSLNRVFIVLKNNSGKVPYRDNKLTFLMKDSIGGNVRK